MKVVRNDVIKAATRKAYDCMTESVKDHWQVPWLPFSKRRLEIRGCAERPGSNLQGKHFKG